MTIEEIRENAPEGSTHYHADDYECWYFKVDGNDLMQWVDGGFVWVDVYCRDYYSELKLI